MAKLPTEALDWALLKLSDCAVAELEVVATAPALLELVACAPAVLPVAAEELAELLLFATEVEVLPLEAFEIALLLLLACEFALLGEGPVAVADEMLVESAFEPQESLFESVLDCVPVQLAVCARALPTLAHNKQKLRQNDTVATGLTNVRNTRRIPLWEKATVRTLTARITRRLSLGPVECSTYVNRSQLGPIRLKIVISIARFPPQI
jgi:hypothetical protein